jgi:hypothetical protein
MFNPTNLFLTNVLDFNDSAKQIQSTIPLKEKVLLRTAYNYSFDFRKKRIASCIFLAQQVLHRTIAGVWIKQRFSKLSSIPNDRVRHLSV